jgi:hypothetical protein
MAQREVLFLDDGSGHQGYDELVADDLPAPAVEMARVDGNETTTSTSYVDLATPGPAATITVPASGKARVTITAAVFNSGTDQCSVGIAVSGATTTAADDARALRTTITAAHFWRVSMSTVFTGLTPGSTTFTMKYRVNAGTGNFSVREINAEPVT